MGDSHNEIDACHLLIPTLVMLHLTMALTSFSKDIIDILHSVEPLCAVGDAIMGGLDKPALSNNYPPVYMTSPFLSHSRGIEPHVNNLGPLDPASQQLTDREHTQSDARETLIKNLVTKKSLLGTYKWTSDMVEGTKIAEFVVSPTHDTGVWKDGQTFLMPMISTISQHFVFWRGKIIFEIDFVCSNWQEGRVDIAYQPNQVAASPTYKQAISQYAVSYTIRNGRNIISAEFPYIAAQPWRRVWHGEPLKDDPTGDYFKSSDFVNGVFSLWVSSPLKAPNTVVPNMDINVYKAAGSDYELSYTDTFGTSRPTYFSEFTKRIRPQSDDAQANAETIVQGDEDVDDSLEDVPTQETPAVVETKKPVPTVTKINKAPTKKKSPAGFTQVYNPNKISVLADNKDNSVIIAPKKMQAGDPKNPHFGESYHDLIDICKRYFPLSTNYYSNSFINALPADVKNGALPFVMNPSLYDLNAGAGGMLNTLANIFRNFRGSINYKVRVLIAGTTAGNPTTGSSTNPERLKVTIRPSSFVTQSPTGQVTPVLTEGKIFVNNAPVSQPSGYQGVNNAIMVSRTGEWMEFKLPFVKPHSSALISKNENAPLFTDTFIGLNQFSVAILGDMNNISNIVVETYFALGDEATMWCFFMQPLHVQLAPKNICLGPDNYPVAPVLQKQESIEVIDSSPFLKTNHKSEIVPQSDDKESEQQSSITDNVLNLRTSGGVGLLEQNLPMKIQRPLDNAYSSRAHAENQDLAFDLNKMLSRNNYVGSLTWAISNAADTIISLNGNPLTDVISDLLQTSLATIPFSRFIFWRCSRVKIHFQLTASRFHQGRLLAAFIPSQIPKSDLTETLTAKRLIANDHVMFDPANGTVASLTVPFKHYKGYLDLLNNDCLGQLVFIVLNSLQAVTGSAQTVTVKVFMSIDDSEFTTPRPGATTFNQFKSQFDN